MSYIGKNFRYVLGIILFFCFPSLVFGSSSCYLTADSSEADYVISYEITKLNIDRDNVSFEGWTFLNHMDNYGGKNMEVSVVAYTGDWCDDNTRKTISKAVQFGALDTDSNIFDLYFTRCTGGACGDNTRKKINGLLKNDKKQFEDKSCTEDGKYKGSHCAYYNVSFKVEFSVDDIITAFGDNAAVKFRLVTKVYYGTNKNNSSFNGHKYAGFRVDSTDIGVIKNACGKIYGRRCNKGKRKNFRKDFPETSTEDGKIITKTVTRSVKVDGLDTKVKFTASIARAFANKEATKWYTESGKQINYNSPSNTARFNFGKDYTVVAYGSFKEYKNYKSNSGTFRMRMLHIQRDDKLPGKGNDGWAWSSWVKTSGSLTLNLSKKEKVSDPPDNGNCKGKLYCIGSGCTYDEDGCPVYTSPQSVQTYSCNESLPYKECGSISGIVSCNKTQEEIFYYKMSAIRFDEDFDTVFGTDEDPNPYTLDEKYDRESNDFYYFPIKFYANVRYTQNFSLDLLNAIPSKVYAGRSFLFQYSYKASASWNYLGNYVAQTSEDNTYDSVIRLDFYDKSKQRQQLEFAISLNENDSLYSCSGNSCSIVGNYSKDLYDQFVQKSINNTSFNNLDSRLKSNKVNFKDSNDAKTDNFMEDYGSFTCDSVLSGNWGLNSEKTIRCSYLIGQSHFLADGSGKVKYGNLNEDEKAKYEDGETGSLYYVPLNYNGGNFAFAKINFQDLSLLDGMKISNSAVCSVSTDNVINKVRYRSIDEKNPFPTGIIPGNWSSYGKIDSGFSRITKQPFNNEKISYQTDFLTTRFGSSNNDYGDYSDYKDMNRSGSSSFIQKEDAFIIRRGNHCHVGDYSTNCDSIQNNP